MRRHIGEPLSAVDHIGLTALPEEAILGAVAEAVDWLASRAGSLAEASARMGDGAANATDPPPSPREPNARQSQLGIMREEHP
jgi:hypothetical protein